MKFTPSRSRKTDHLASYDDYGLLDTPLEAVFDNLIELARSFCNVPIALISLVYRDRHWIKVGCGLSDLDETASAIVFCEHTLNHKEFLQISDTAQDRRFRNNSLVTGESQIRFFAGTPLISPAGIALGTLCVIDRRTRKLTQSQVNHLQRLATTVMALFESQQQERALVRRLVDGEVRYRAVVEDQSELICRFRLDYTITFVNRAYASYFEKQPSELIGTSLVDLLPEQSFSDLNEHIKSLTPEHPTRIHERMEIATDGTPHWQQWCDRGFFDRNGNINELQSVGRDITERIQMEAALAAEKERAQVTLESIGDGVITTDSHGRVDYLNPVAEEMTGWSLSEAVTKSLSEVYCIVDEHDGTSLAEPVAQCLAHENAGELSKHTVLLSRGGAQYAIENTVAPIHDYQGKLVGTVLVFRNVSEQRQLQRRLVHQAQHDDLTGLPNRREFEQRLQLALKDVRSRQSQHALCYLDLDEFKVVNDTCGHIAGDELLRQLGAMFKSKIRQGDTLARLGGDEFGILLKHCSLDQAQRVTNGLRETLEEYRFCWEDNRFRVGVSIGLVPVRAKSDSVAGLLKAADSACYVAKESGRNRVHIYREHDRELARRHGEMQWVNRIQQALEEDRFELYAQPIKSLKDDSSQGLYCELLLRLIDPNGQVILPRAFMPAAERYHLTVNIDRWVVTHALRWLADHPVVLEQLNLCTINLSGHSLSDRFFHAHVFRQFDLTGVPPQKLCFEITETTAIANLVDATRFMKTLKSHGCYLALDDFGSGLSSFGYLKSLPVDFLKIDGLFVKDICDDPIDLSMVRSINEIGQLLGKRTIAEHVENQEIVDRLRALGVDYGQGYGLGRPVPLQQLIPMAEEATNYPQTDTVINE